MKASIAGLALTFVWFALAVPAFAGVEEITLADGTTGFAEVLETSADSITVKFKKNETPVKLKLMANRVDSHCFYEIRRRYMEETAENHLNLAILCAKSGMYKRAEFQLSVAEALDPEYVEKMRKTPGVREGVAKDVMASAEAAHKKGDLDLAGEIAVIVLARFSDLSVADQARDLLGRIRLMRRGMEAAEKAKAEAARDEEATKAAEEVAKALAPVEKARKRADEIYAQAVSMDKPGKAKDAFDAAAALYAGALRKCEKLAEKHDHPDVARLEGVIRADAVGSLISAGRIALTRGSRTEAGKYAQRALKLDPESRRAKTLLSQIDTAEMMDDTFDARYRRAARRPGRR